MSVSACSSTAMHFLTGSAKWDFDSEVVSLGVFEKPARLWSEALAIVVREVVIVWGRVEPRPGFCGWIGEPGSFFKSCLLSGQGHFKDIIIMDNGVIFKRINKSRIEANI